MSNVVRKMEERFVSRLVWIEGFSYSGIRLSLSVEERALQVLYSNLSVRNSAPNGLDGSSLHKKGAK